MVTSSGTGLRQQSQCMALRLKTLLVSPAFLSVTVIQVDAGLPDRDAAGRPVVARTAAPAPDSGAF
jgi:hypothetical protein